MYEGSDIVERAWLGGINPDAFMTISEWSDLYRYLSLKSAAEPGRWRTDRTPYLREIMDELSPHKRAQRVVFMKGAQIGGTEAGNNWMGYVIHMAPGPMMAVAPTVEMAKRNSKQRIDPLLEDSKELKERVKPARSKDSGNTVLSKEFPGGVLVMTGANSAVGLRSMPVRYLFMDEVDGYPGDVEGEGDPVALAEARTQTFSRRKIFLVSTPTIKGVSRIEREYLASDQRRYFVPCPHCGEMQWLQFERLRWDKGEPQSAHYVCIACEAKIAEHHKTNMLATGEWRAMIEEPCDTVGFHISSLYSPIGWKSWADIASAWESAQGNDAALKTVVNTLLGEVWQERGEAPDWQRLYDRREDFALGFVPKDAVILTAGGDVQGDRIEIDVWGWGKGMTSWLVDHIVLYGSPGSSEVWEQLSDVMKQAWQHQSGNYMKITKLGIDTAGGFEAMAYKWCRGMGTQLVMPIKGASGYDRSSPVTGPTSVEAMEGGRKLRHGVKLWRVSGAVFKSELYAWLRLDKPTDEGLVNGEEAWPEGYVHLPKQIDSEWIKQLVGEQLMTITNNRGFPKLEWQKIRERNEALDCRVYARAAAWLIGLDRWHDKKWQQRIEEVNQKPSHGEASSLDINRHNTGFIAMPAPIYSDNPWL